MKFSILIPVYNERYTVAELIRRVLDSPLPGGLERELVIVDDGSTDGTREILERLAAEHPEIVYHPHEQNTGKGGAIRTAIRLASGDFCIFQDADLEYDPRDYAQILEPLLAGEADVVYGSRFLSRERRRVLSFWHSQGNRILTAMSNMLTDLSLTDMETCYKAFRTELLKTIPVRSNDFGLEPELTAKVAKRGFRVYEVPISYHGRTYALGKKITWKDGVRAFWVMLKFWVIDDLFSEHAGAEFLASLEKAYHFNSWMADRVRPFLGHRVLEVGAGIGNLSQMFLPRDHYVAAESDELHLKVLRNLALQRPYLEVARLDALESAHFRPYTSNVDTIVCLNLLAQLADPAPVLKNFHDALVPGGSAVVLVPQGPRLYGRLDEALQRRKRYSKQELRSELEAAGFEVERLLEFNKIGAIGWWFNGKLLGRNRIPKFQLKLFDSLVWLWRRLEPVLPWPGLFLIAVARKPAADARPASKVAAG